MHFDWIDGNTFWYIPIIVFTFVMVVSVIVGFLNGWAVALYFLGFQVLFFGVGLAVYSVVYNALEGWIARILPDDVKRFVGDPHTFLDAVKSPLGFVYMVAAGLLGFLVSIIIYPFVRRFLKRTHRVATNFDGGKRAKKSSRFFGVVIGAFTGLVFAAPMTSIAYTATTKVEASEKNFLYNFSSKFVESISFGIYADPMRLQATLNAVAVATSPAVRDLISKIARGNFDPAELVEDFKNAYTQENVDKLETVLNNPTLLEGVRHQVVELVSGLAGVRVNQDHEVLVDTLSDGSVERVVAAFVESGVPKLTLSQSAFNTIIHESLGTYITFKNADGTTASPDEVAPLLEALARNFINIG